MDSFSEYIDNLSDEPISTFFEKPGNVCLLNSSFSVLHLNIRSANKNFEEFVLLLQSMRVDFDLLVLTECWLRETDGSVFHIPGYITSYSYAKQNKNDGILVFVKDTLVPNIISNTFSSCNALAMSVIKNKETYNILAIYRSPSERNLMPFIEEMGEFCETKFSMSHKNLILGDINLNILDDESANNETRDLYLNNLLSLGYNSAINLPTRVSDNCSSCLDHIFVNFRANTSGFVLDSAITDHYPTVLSIAQGHTPRAASVNNNSNTRRVTKKIDYQKLLHEISQLNWGPLLTSRDPDVVANLLLESITRVELSCTTFRNETSKTKLLKPWLTLNLLRCIRKRDRLAKASKDQPRNNQLLNHYKSYRNKLCELLRLSKTNYFKNKINQNGAIDLKKTWNVVREIANDSCKASSKMNLVLPNGELTKTSFESANCFNSYSVRVGNDLAAQIDPIADSYVPSEKINNHVFILTPVTDDEVSKLICSLKSNSSCGPDGISAKTLKIAKDFITQPVTHLVNCSFKSGKFPNALKTAHVIPIHKGGDKSLPENYRPISLTSQIAKILEKALKLRLVNFLEDSNFLSDRQFGFRLGKSTQDAMHHLTKSVHDALIDSKKVIGVFLDIKKAFDTVPHDLLLRKIKNAGIIGLPFKLLADYLTERVQYTKVDGVLSNSLPVSCGVPQGTVLGPILFILYINDLCSMIIDGALTCFADDTGVILSADSWDSVAEKANDCLSKIKCWLDFHKLSLNVSKTNFLTFAPSHRSLPNNIELKIHNSSCQDSTCCQCQAVSSAKTIKYLGITLDGLLKWDVHTLLLTKRIRRTFFIFLKLRNILDCATLRNIYFALIQSLLSYGVLIWGGTSIKYLKPVFVAQKSVLKIILKLNRRYPTHQLFLDANVPTLRQLHVEQLLLHFFKKGFSLSVPIHNYSTRNRQLPRFPQIGPVASERSPDLLCKRLMRQNTPVINELRIQTNFRKFKQLAKKYVRTVEDSELVNLLYNV